MTRSVIRTVLLVFVVQLIQANRCSEIIAKGNGGGILGGLGGIGGKPDRDDSAERPPAATRPGRAASTSRPNGTDSADDTSVSGNSGLATSGEERSEASADRIRLEQEIDKLTRALEAERDRSTFQPVNHIDDAERQLQALEEGLDEMKRNLDQADRDAARELREEEAAFVDKWKDVAGAIESVERPADMSRAEWASTLDRFHREKALLEARKAHLKRVLQDKRTRQMALQELLVDNARKTIRKLRESFKDQDARKRKGQTRLFEEQARAARIQELEQRRRELKALLSERLGQKSGREDPLIKDVYRSTGYWYVDVLAREFRKVFIQSHKQPPFNRELGLPDPADTFDDGNGDASSDTDTDAVADEGLPFPEWLKDKPDRKGLKPEDFRKARLKSLQSHLEDSKRRMANVQKQTELDDVAELDQLQRQLEYEDRLAGDEEVEKRRSEREARILARKRELDASREGRVTDQRQKLERHIEYLKRKERQISGSGP